MTFKLTKESDGLHDNGCNYIYDGDLIADNIYIKLDKPLSVKGNIISDGYIISEVSLDVTGSIISHNSNIHCLGYIEAYGHVKAHGTISTAHNLTSLKGSIDCFRLIAHGNIYAYNVINANDSIFARGTVLSDKLICTHITAHRYRNLMKEKVYA